MRNATRRGLSLLLALVMLCSLLPGEAWAAAGDPEGSAAWAERREEDSAQTGPEDPPRDPTREDEPEEGGEPSPADPSAPEGPEGGETPEPDLPEPEEDPDLNPEAPEEAEEPAGPEEEAEPEAELLAWVNKTYEYNSFKYKLNEDKNACSIVGYTGSETDLVIPDEINGIPVTEIGDRAFSGKKQITRVVLPESLKTIGSQAFYECSSLTEIRIPQNVTAIGSSAFSYCSKLVRVDLTCSAPAIGAYAFGSCPSLAAVCFYGEPPVLLGSTSFSSLFPRCFSSSYNSNFFCVSFPQGSALAKQPGSDWNGYRTDVFRPLSGREETYTDSVSGVTLRFDPDTGVITGYAGEPADLVIPGEINGITVTGIAPGAFYQCASLTSLTLPEGITYLGTGAFCGCTSLTSVSLPGTLEIAGASAFQGCSKLSRVSLSSGMKYLGACMFAKCSALTGITLPEGIPEIPDFCFYNCKLTSADAPFSIPQGVTRIGERAFYYTTLTAAAFPEGLKTIGEFAFYSSALTAVDLPAGVTSIGNGAFSGCGKLTGVTLREGLESIGLQAFYSCQNLSSINLPDGVTGIGDSAFKNCCALTKITVPGSVKFIGESAFEGDGLTSVTLNEGLQEIRKKAFSNNKLTRIEIPSTVTKLGQYAFSSCRSLEAAFFYGDAPACVSSSGSGSGYFFSECKSTFKIFYNISRSGWTENPWEGYPTEPFSPASGDNVVRHPMQGCTLLFNPGSGMIVGYDGSPTDLAIPAEIQGSPVTGVSPEVFASCGTLTSVTLPEGLETVGTRSFYNCANLTSAALPSTLKRMGSSAFQNCTKLENLPGMGSQTALKALGESAFSGCIALKAAALPGSLEEIPASCFSGCTSLDSVTFAPGLRRIGDSAFEKSGLTAADLPEGLESIKLNAFLECAALESVNLPKSLTEIGSCAFKSCAALTGIVIPDSAQTLGASVFYGCTSLESAVLPGGIARIPNEFFYSCSKLPKIEIPDTVTEIGGSAFRGCKALTRVTLPKRLITIGASAFSHCTGLTRIDIPDSVTSIGSSAFYNCSHLASAFFCGEPPALETTPSRFRDCAGSFTIHFIDREGTAWTKPLWNSYKTEPFTFSQNAAEFALDNGAVLFDRDTGLITGYTGAPGKAVIPSQIEDAPVLGIMASAFESCATLTSIELPEGLVSIGSHAFSGCSALTGVTLPQSLERIGTAAFQNCVQLKEITLPAGVSEIPDYTFYGCTALGSAVLPEELSDVGTYAFSNCASMTELTIPDSVSSLGRNAFSSCGALKKVTLPAGIQTIPQHCFEECGALEGIEIPENVSTIEQYAFNECIGLKEVVFHEGLKTIRDRAFASCKSLLRVDFPESLELLDGMIFDRYSALRDAYFYGEPPKTGQYLVFSNTSGVKVHYIQREGTAWPENKWQSCYPTEPFVPAPKDPVDIQVTGGTLLLDKDTGLISGYSGNLSALVIPASAEDGTPVLGIAGTVFSDCASLTSVTLEEGLKTVGGSAFKNCCALKTVSLPSTLEEIGGSAFRDCAALETVDLQSSKIRRIPSYCFSGCSALSSVKLPETLDALGEYAFSSCGNLSSISLPEGIPEIPDNCFSSCNKLEEVHIPKTVKKILPGAFFDCYHMTRVTLEEGLVSIGNNSFYRCRLSRVDLPSTVTEIASDAFHSCSGLTAAYFYGSAPASFSAASSGFGSFRDCASSFKIYYLADKDGWTPVSWNGYATEIFTPASGNTAEFPVDGGTLRFDRNSGLIVGYTESPRVIDLPAEIENIPVTGIAVEAFANCASLTSVTLPEGLQTIGANAFLNCTALNAVTLPKGLQTLGGSAFSGCTALTEITLPDSLEEIGLAAFRECTNLRQVRLSDNLRALSQEIFRGCTSLEEITLPKGLQTVGGSAFYGCTALTGITLPASVASIGTSAFYGCKKLKDVTLPEGLTKLGSSAFYQCEALTGIVIPDGVTALNGSTFNGCASLETVLLPDNLETIEDHAFSSCGKLTYIVLPDSLTKIGEYAFGDCAALKEIVIPPKVKGINKKAFYSCKLLTSVTLPEGLTSIGEDAFASCTSLPYIRIPSTVNSINNRAFRACSALRAAYFLGNAPITLSAGGNSSSSSFFACSSAFKIYYINGKADWTTPTWKNYPTVCMPLKNGTYYEAVTTPMTWEEAQAYAAKQGGRLASAPNEDLADYLEALARAAGAGSLWLGGRKDSGGAWTWLSGADWDYTRFPEGSQQSGPYLCLQLPDGGGAGSWTAGTAEETHGFLLEVSMDPSATERPSGNQELTHPVEGGALRFDPKTGTVTGYTGSPVNITVPKAIRGFPVTAINAAAFNDCASLDSLSAEAGHSAFSAADGILYTADGSALLLCPKTRTGEVTLPEACTAVGKYAFACCAGITSVTLPQGLTGIREGAFFQCGGLTTLTVPEGLAAIDGSAFRGCGQLAQVYFPGDAPALGGNAFDGGDGLTLFYIHGRYGWTEPLWNNLRTESFQPEDGTRYYAIDGGSLRFSTETKEILGCSGSPATAAIPMEIAGTPVTGIGAGAFRDQKNLTAVYLPFSLERIGEDAFAGCSSGLTLYGPKGSVGANYAGTHGITFTVCAIASVSPDTASTVGGAKTQEIAATMTGPVTLPLTWTLQGPDGQEIPLAQPTVKLNSSGQAVHTLALDLTELASGSYTLRLHRSEYGVDTAVTYDVDRTPPAQPKSLRVTPGSLRNILTWDRGPEADIQTVRIYRGTNPQADPVLRRELTGSDVTTYTDQTLADDTTEYFYWISFADRFSQESALAGPVSSKAQADTEAPTTITGMDPVNGKTLTGTVTFRVSAEDNVQLASIAMVISREELTGDEAWTDPKKTETLATVHTGKTAQFTLDSTLYGTELYVRFLLTDSSGNRGWSNAVYHYPIDNVPPEQVANLRAQTAATVITLRWDDVTAKDLDCFLVEELQADGTWKEIGQVRGTLGMNITGLTPRSAHTYRVAARDVNGNTGPYSDPVTASATADTTPPVIQKQLPASSRYKDPISLSFTVWDDHGIRSLTVETSPDGQTWNAAGTVEITEPASQTTEVRYSLDTAAFPEGPLYVRGIAEDLSGNKSDISSDAPLVQYVVDRTAPAAPAGLKASLAYQSIHLSWEQGPETDLNGYRVYRQAEGEEKARLLTGGLEMITYTDKDVAVGQTYTYYLTCADTAGNVSEASQSVTVTMAAIPDTEPPRVVSVSPADGYTLGLETPLKVKVFDDQLVQSLSFRLSADGSSWTDWETVEAGEAEGVITLPKTAKTTEGDQLYLEVYCTDAAGQRSDTVRRTYAVDRTLPATPKLTKAEAGIKCVNLAWTCESEEHLAGFYIFRQAADGSESGWTQVGQIAPAGQPPYAYTFTDKSVQIKSYTYRVSAVTAIGNRADSAVTEQLLPRDGDVTPPTVRITGNTVGTAGTEMSFSAARSTDDVGIVSYLWDFGDESGTSSLKEPRHAYQAAGSYTVTLTVSDAAGNKAQGLVHVRVMEPGQAAVLNVSVIDENGRPVPDAGVYFNLGDAQDQNTVYTNASGAVQILAEEGKYRVGAYKSGYLPAQRTVELLKGAPKDQKLSLVKGDIVTGELTVDRMTLQEIEAAGIDPALPANQEVFQYEVVLTYGSEKAPIHTLINSAGDILVDPKPIVIKSETQQQRTLYPFVLEGKKEPVGGGGMVGPEVPLIAVLDMPGETRWMKDFFDVRLYIFNQAQTSFVLDNCTAVLKVPEGLTLVDNERTESVPQVNLGSIAGQSSAAAEWILRGDRPGDYTLSASFRGTLRDFNEEITAQFETGEAFHVRQGDNLFLDVMLESAVGPYGDGAVRVGLRNEDPEPYNLPSISLEKAQLVSTFKTKGLAPVNTDLRVLNPGEEIWFDYVVARADWETLTKREDETFYLLNQLGKALEGKELQISFLETAPYTVAADRLEVYEILEDGSLAEIQYIDARTTGRVPDLKLITYRLDQQREYKPCSMKLTVADSLKMRQSGEPDTVTTGADGSLILKGYDLPADAAGTEHTLGIYPSRGRPAELPLVLPGAGGKTGTLQISAGILGEDGTVTAVPGAQVTLEGESTLTQTTDESGQAVFADIPQGLQTVRIQAAGCLPLAQAVRVNRNTVQTFLLTKDSDPSASRVTAVSGPLLDSAEGSYAVIPYGVANGVAEFTPKKRIAQGETFQRFRYRITAKDGTVREEVPFDDASTMLDIANLQPGDSLSFAVDTQAGGAEKTSAFTPVRIRVVEMPEALSTYASGMINIAKAPDNRITRAIDLTEHPGFAFTPLAGFAPLTYLQGFTGDNLDPPFSDMTDAANQFTIRPREAARLYPVSISYETGGSFTLAFLFGAKPQPQEETDGNGETEERPRIFQADAQSFFDLTEAHDQRAGAEGTILLELIYTYDPLEDRWTRQLQGEESVKSALDTLYPESSWRVVSQAKTEENAAWSLSDPNPEGAIDEDLFSGESLSALGLTGGLRVDLGGKPGAHSSLTGYLESGFQAAYDSKNGTWSLKLEAEIGRERTFLAWKSSGAIVQKEWEITPGGGSLETAEAELLSLLAGEPETALDITGNTGASWTGGGEVIAQGIYGESAPQTVTLPDGRTLMVFIDAGGSNTNPSNPTELKYSIYENGQWSAPKPVSGDGTMDLSPALTATESGAAAVWIDLSEKLTGAESMTVSAIQEQVCSKMTVRMSVFNESTNTWSDPVTLGSPNCLAGRPAVASGGGRTAAVWIQNSANTEQADAAHPDTVAYAVAENGKVVESGTVPTASGAAGTPALAYSGGVFTLACGTGSGELASLRLENGSWIGGGALSHTGETDAAAASDSDGTLYCIAGDRLLAKRGGAMTELAASGLLAGGSDLRALRLGEQTFLIWVQSDDSGNRICLCAAPKDGAASQPVILAESQDSQFLSPSVIPNGTGYAAVYLSRTYGADQNNQYAASCQLRQTSLPMGKEVRLDSAETRPLYPGAAVTILYRCSNRGLASAESVTLTVSRDPGGTDPIETFANQKLSGSLDWRVPANYGGEQLYLTVSWGGASSDSAPLGSAFVDLAVSGARLMGAQDGAVKVTLENNGLANTGEITLSVQDPAGGTDLYQETVGGLDGGARSDYVLPAADLQGLKTVRITAKAANGDVKAENNRRNVYLSALMAQPVVPDPGPQPETGLVFGEPEFTCENGRIQFTQTVTNKTGEAAGAVLFLSLYDAGGKLLRTVQRSVQPDPGEGTLQAETVLTAAEKAAATGTRTASVILADQKTFAPLQGKRTLQLKG